MGVTPFVSAALVSSDYGNDLYLSSFTPKLLSVLLSLLMLLERERHLSAQQSPSSRTCEIDTKQRRVSFLSAFVVRCVDEILMIFEARLRLGVRQCIKP